VAWVRLSPQRVRVVLSEECYSVLSDHLFAVCFEPACAVVLLR
jgi:hypothetical protein